MCMLKITYFQHLPNYEALNCEIGKFSMTINSRDSRKVGLED